MSDTTQQYDPFGLFQYTHQQQPYRFTPVGCHKPTWLMESFSLENDLRTEWWCIKQGDVVLDVGAGFGSYTLTALAAGASLVVAVEPSKEEGFSLLQNVCMNPGFLLRTVLVPLLLSDKSNTLVNYDTHTHSCHPDATEVRLTITGDDLVLDRLGMRRLDWVKVDVEGAELAVLNGLVRTMSTLKPRVLVECHEGSYPGIIVLVDKYMTDHAYKLSKTRDGEGGNDRWRLYESC